MENNEKKSGKWEIKLENWRWHRWHGAGEGEAIMGGAGKGWERIADSGLGCGEN